MQNCKFANIRSYDKNILQVCLDFLNLRWKIFRLYKLVWDKKSELSYFKSFTPNGDTFVNLSKHASIDASNWTESH